MPINNDKFNEENYIKDRVTLLKNWEFINTVIYKKVAQQQADYLEQSNENTNSRRNVYTFPDECYVMFRVTKRNKIQKRFLGPFRAVKRDQVFELYDKNNTYFDTCAQYELKKVRIASKDQIIDLSESQDEIIDDGIDGLNTQERADSDFHPTGGDSYILQEDDEFNKQTAQERLTEPTVEKRSGKSKNSRSSKSKEIGGFSGKKRGKKRGKK